LPVCLAADSAVRLFALPSKDNSKGAAFG